MLKNIKIFIPTLFLILFVLKTHAFAMNDHRIAVLVNDQLITSYDIFQRMKMNAILSGTDITPENNRQLTNTVVEELIREKLQNEKISEFNISVSDNEYLQQELSFYEKLPINKEDIKKIFEINNIKYDQFRDYLTSQISWQKLISSMYYRLTSASEIEIDEIMMNNPNLTKNDASNIIIQKQLDLKSSKMIRDMFDEATIEYK